MPIVPGQELLHYRLVEQIGEGGMGVVWKAVDTTLDREVAIKTLPEAFAADAERLTRFEREARLLASLNHPNIATVHSVHEAEGLRFLAMELVAGEDLAQRLDRGAIPVDEALQIAMQIAEALEAAHEAGVIHRDLKPANIKLTPDGRVKVLDFGLAKALTPDPPERSGAPTPSMSPTVTSTGTAAGVILGTAAYMSPEQARGRPVDRRTDIWSFGVVLFETLTGRPLFRGESVPDSIGAILHKEPDWSTLPGDTPPLVRLLLRRCLQKDRKRRLRDIGDALIDLRAAVDDPSWNDSLAPRPGPGRRRRSAVLFSGALLAAVTIGVAIGWAAKRTPVPLPATPMVRFSIDLSEHDLTLDTNSSNLALDPSGRLLAFVARRDGGEWSIYVRPLESTGDARALPGTEGGRRPFFSPDGRWLGFIRDGKLMKLPSTGGPALTICDCKAIAHFADPAWLDDGTIVFVTLAPVGMSLQRVDSGGGDPETLAAPDLEGASADARRAIMGFDCPLRIPGREFLLATIYDGITIEDYDLVAVSVENGSVRRIFANASEPRYSPERLFFTRQSSLFAASFDTGRGVIAGEPEQVLDSVLANTWTDNVQYAVAGNGTLVYVPGSRRGPGRKLVRVDSDGRSEPLLEQSDALTGGLRASRDGRRLTLITLRRKPELWSLDLQDRSFTLINDTAPSFSPVWVPGKNEVVYQREGTEGAPNTVVRQSSDGSDSGKSLAPAGASESDSPTSVSPDGKILLVTRFDPSPQRGNDIVALRLDEERPAEPLLVTAADESDAVFAPDGKRYAYSSDESGRTEIYVRDFPDTGRRRQVSTDGGHQPRWSASGDKLFFISGFSFFRSRVRTDSGFAADRPEKLFDLEGVAIRETWHTYDVLPDDSFVMIEPAPWETEPMRIEVVVGWDGEPLRD